ncbi:hypothetical protein MLD38_018564 [Melastoma candidum]|uniref:Uncharacterized protein n=1 Tax=Melastoma candidum TaxID=119954 RepID=A0ACB9QUR1_9MYRT|nr:hypothetical protein MLD38_018564 [Melastoma candidum]
MQKTHPLLLPSFLLLLYSLGFSFSLLSSESRKVKDGSPSSRKCFCFLLLLISFRQLVEVDSEGDQGM